MQTYKNIKTKIPKYTILYKNKKNKYSINRCLIWHIGIKICVTSPKSSKQTKYILTEVWPNTMIIRKI